VGKIANEFKIKYTIKLLGILIIFPETGILINSCLSYDTVNSSLHGGWSRGDIAIIFDDNNNGYFTQIHLNSEWQPFLNNGLVNIGDQKFRQVIQMGNRRWSCEELSGRLEYYSSGTIKYTGVRWVNCTIVMSTDGKTIQVTTNDPSVTINPSSNYTRVQ
jgi:hypothetical protein